jgi:hypothetical protein
MSISTVVTRGYGAFGSVNKLPTWGYGIGAGVVSPTTGVTRSTVLVGPTRLSSTIIGPSQDSVLSHGPSYVSTTLVGTNP